jgi:hypothetical protein
MEILQQRLIWLSGTSSLYIILLRLTSSNSKVSRGVSIKLGAGVGLIAFGALAGSVSRTGIVGNGFMRSGATY